MPTERMEEVEVVVPCHNCNGTGEAWYTHEMRQPLGCHVCSASREVVRSATVAPGSLTAARLRLADAAERCDKAAKATAWCHTVFGTEEECAAWYAKVGYTEADALAVEQECYAARMEYDLALAALRTARGA